jgi:DNA-binding PadR family transcriptional regulator
LLYYRQITYNQKTHMPGPLKNADFYILLALAGGPRHGYGVMKEVERESGGEVRLEIGSLYRLLSRLLQSGQIEEAGGDGRRRCYRISRLGRRALKSEAVRLAGLVAMVRARKLLPEVHS